MTTIRFREDAKVPRFILRERRIEGLNQFPYVRSCRLSRRDRVGTVGEPYTNGLVDVQHVRIVVEAEGVVDRRGTGATQGKFAWAVFLEEPYHRAAARTPIKPRSERSCGGILSCFEKPGPFSDMTVRSDEKLTRTTCSCSCRR
jgi:hypothetical protein